MNPANAEEKRRIPWIRVLPMVQHLCIRGMIPSSNLEKGGNPVCLDFPVSIAAPGLTRGYSWPPLGFGGLGTRCRYLLNFAASAGTRAIFRIGQKHN